MTPALLHHLRTLSARAASDYYRLARVWLSNARLWAASGDWDLVVGAVLAAGVARDLGRYQRRLAGGSR